MRRRPHRELCLGGRGIMPEIRNLSACCSFCYYASPNISRFSVMVCCLCISLFYFLVACLPVSLFECAMCLLTCSLYTLPGIQFSVQTSGRIKSKQYGEFTLSEYGSLIYTNIYIYVQQTICWMLCLSVFTHNINEKFALILTQYQLEIISFQLIAMHTFVRLTVKHFSSI